MAILRSMSITTVVTMAGAIASILGTMTSTMAILDIARTMVIATTHGGRATAIMIPGIMIVTATMAIMAASMAVMTDGDIGTMAITLA